MSTKRDIVPESTLTKQRQEGFAILAPLKPKVTGMVVTTQEQYLHADEVLTSIRQAKKGWEDKLNPIIQPIRAGLDLLYGLRKDIVDNLELLESQVKYRMRAFKIQEERQLMEAEEKRQAEEAKIQQQIDAKTLAEDKAKTPAMTKTIMEAKARLEQSLANSRANVAQPVRASGSIAKKRKVWVVTDKAAFISYLIEKKPELLSMVEVDSTQMNALYKIQKPELGEWMPGVVVEEDLSIAGRG